MQGGAEKTMFQRILTSVIAVAVMIPFLCVSDTYVFVAAIAVFAAIAVYEMAGCIGTRKSPALFIPSLLVAAAAPFGARALGAELFLKAYLAVTFLYMFFLLCVAVLARGKMQIGSVGIQFFTTFYISIAFSGLILLRDMEHGLYIMLMALCSPWVCDIFAYFMGVFFGKHKLIPEISPKKTVEGSIGGTLFCTAAFAGYGYFIGQMTGHTPSYLALCIAGFAVAIVSQFGDLIASLIKREYGIKDYGHLFVGHGGVLDRFDSVMAVVPLVLMMALSGFFPFFS